MVRPRPIPDLDPRQPARAACAGLLRVRAEEVAELTEHIADPTRVAELHALRVTVKRLRYLIDVLRPWLARDPRPVRKELSALQDLLGAIHDCDVGVEDHRRLLVRRLRELRREAKALPSGAGASGARLGEAAGSLAHDLSRGAARGLCLLIGDLVERRGRLHARLAKRWRRLAQEGFLRDVLELAASV